MRTLELKGFKSLKALNVFHSLMLGLKMLPSYRHLGYEEFLESVQNMSPPDQEKLIRESALFVELERDEVEAMVCFVVDNNGVPYTSENLKNMSPDKIYEMVVAVALEVAKIKINFVTESEKKN